MQAKAVGVIIPLHNPGPYFVETLASVRQQSFDDLHIYIVDDGSAEVPQVADAPDVTFVSRANAGVSRTRNFAASLGEEPLLAFLDQDDVWHPDKLATQVTMLDRHPDASGCFTWARMIDNAGNDLGPAYGAYDHDIVDGKAFGGGVILSSLVLRRTAFAETGGFDPLLRITQDWDLLLRASYLGPVLGIYEYLTKYRVHDANTSRDFRALARESAALLDRVAARCEPDDRPDVLRARRDFAQLAAAKGVNYARTAAKERRLSDAVGAGAWATGQTIRARVAARRARLAGRR